MATNAVRVSVYHDGKLINEVRFDRPIINIGKLSTATLRLDDINVSRKHAVIEQRDDGRWRVTDLGSTNGTLLRGERVVQADLADGDRLVLGTTTLVVHIDAADVRPVAVASVTSGAIEVAARAPERGAEEIRGLGAESFYKKKAAAEGFEWVLDVALLWGETVLASRTYRRGEAVLLAGGDLAVPRELLGLREHEAFALVPAGERFVLDLSNPNITGDVLVGDGVRSVVEIDARTLPITGPMRARLELGELTLLLAHAPLVNAATIASEFDKEPSIFIGLSAIVQVAFLIIATTAPGDMLLHSRDPRAERDKVVQALRIAVPEDEVVKPREVEIEVREQRTTDESLAVDRVGIPVSTPLVDKMRRKPSPEVAALPRDRARDAKERTQQTALATAFRENNPLLQELMTNPDLDAKPSPFKALGPSVAGGSDYGDTGSVSPFGAFGPGGMQFLPSDGGPDAGKPGPIAGKAKIDVTRGPEFVPTTECCKVLTLAPPRVAGELDAAIVQRTIRGYLPGIKWCYQERVQGNRTLGGKATMSFSILPTGTITDARLTNDTLRDPELEACIVAKMQRWRFPQPRDGGVVEVDYPLILKTQ